MEREENSEHSRPGFDVEIKKEPGQRVATRHPGRRVVGEEASPNRRARLNLPFFYQADELMGT